MENKYQNIVTQLNRKKEKALIVFTVMGDPNYDTSLSIVKTILNSGADILELGFPFSDPIADGPIIQSADARALSNGINTDVCFRFIKEIRAFSSVPIGLLVYYNLVYQNGIEKFYKSAKDSGVDSILIADMPIEEADVVINYSKKYSISQIFMISPLTTEKRIAMITKNSNGFLYLLSRLGVTGTREILEGDAISLIKRVKPFTRLPLFVGFGISKPEHVKTIMNVGADGAIVGSGVVKIIADNLQNTQLMLSKIEEYVREMKSATQC